MLGAFDDLVLEGTIEHVEERAVAGNFNDEVRVLLRMLLGVPQNLAIHHVELDVGNGPLLIPFPEVLGEQLLVVPFEELGHEPLVQELALALVSSEVHAVVSPRAFWV